MGSCGVKKKLSNDLGTGKEKIDIMGFDNKRELRDSLIRSISGAGIDFSHLSIKGKGDVTIENVGNYNIAVLLRMKKNEIFWVSIQAAIGIELFRFLIDKDSIQWINRINNTYEQISVKDYTSHGQDIIRLLQYVLLGKISEEVEAMLIDKSDLVFDKGLKISMKEWGVGFSLYYSPVKEINGIGVEFDNMDLYLDFPLFDKEIIEGKEYVVPAHLKIRYHNAQMNMDVYLDLNSLKFSDKKTNFPFRIPKRYNGKE